MDWLDGIIILMWGTMNGMVGLAIVVGGGVLIFSGGLVRALGGFLVFFGIMLCMVALDPIDVGIWSIGFEMSERRKGR